MESIFANLDSHRLARVTGALLLAARDQEVKSVALTSVDEGLDLSEIAESLKRNLAATQPGIDLEFRLAPGLLSTAAGVVKVREADASLLVVRSGTCQIDPVRQAATHLLESPTQLLGIILAETRNPVPRFLRRIFGMQ